MRKEYDFSDGKKNPYSKQLNNPSENEKANIASLQLRERVTQSIEAYAKALRRFPTRTHQHIEKYGHVEALSRLVKTGDLQQGFTILRNSGKLDKTFEQIIIDFEDDFENEAVDSARFRIRNANNL